MPTSMSPTTLMLLMGARTDASAGKRALRERPSFLPASVNSSSRPDPSDQQWQVKLLHTLARVQA